MFLFPTTNNISLGQKQTAEAVDRATLITFVKAECQDDQQRGNLWNKSLIKTVYREITSTLYFILQSI